MVSSFNAVEMVLVVSRRVELLVIVWCVWALAAAVRRPVPGGVDNFVETCPVLMNFPSKLIKKALCLWNNSVNC